MVDARTEHHRRHAWPSPAFVLGLVLASSKALRPASAAGSTIRTSGKEAHRRGINRLGACQGTFEPFDRGGRAEDVRVL